jgi:hypothetical protein
MESVIWGIAIGFVLYWHIWTERFYDELDEYLEKEATPQ